MSGEIASIISKASVLLSKEDNWCQSASARNSDGMAVTVHSDDAVSWCVYGAVDKVSGLYGNQVAIDTYDFLQGVLAKIYDGGTAVSFWNDAPERTHNEVKLFLNYAALCAEREGV